MDWIFSSLETGGLPSKERIQIRLGKTCKKCMCLVVLFTNPERIVTLFSLSAVNQVARPGMSFTTWFPVLEGRGRSRYRSNCLAYNRQIWGLWLWTALAKVILPGRREPRGDLEVARNRDPSQPGLGSYPSNIKGDLVANLTLRSFAALLSQVGDAKVVETPEESTAISPKGRCDFVPFFSYKSVSALNLKAIAP